MIRSPSSTAGCGRMWSAVDGEPFSKSARMVRADDNNQIRSSK